MSSTTTPTLPVVILNIDLSEGPDPTHPEVSWCLSSPKSFVETPDFDQTCVRFSHLLLDTLPALLDRLFSAKGTLEHVYRVQQSLGKASTSHDKKAMLALAAGFGLSFRLGSVRDTTEYGTRMPDVRDWVAGVE